MKLAMVAAVLGVFLLAYVDLRREQARVLDDFVAEQALLARSVAETLRARLALALRDVPATSDAVRGEVRRGLEEIAIAVQAPPSPSSEPATSLRWLVLDRSGAVVGDPPAAPTPDVAELFARMHDGKAGASILGREAAASLGLGRRMAVAGYAPVQVATERWSVAVIVSARRVRDRARYTAWRLTITTGLASVMVALFGVAVARQQRRWQTLAQALQLAEATASERERSSKLIARAEKLATIGTLAAGVAHEVGTPLGIISGRAEQLLARLPEGAAGDPSRKNVESILAQVDKVSTTIRQLLDFSRIRPIDAEAVTPAQLLEHAASLLSPHFRKASVALDVDASPMVPPVTADAGQLEQVLVNLLMNACDACAPGGHVRAHAVLRGDRVVLEIADDGAGIAPEHLHLVLDPFFTTKKRGQGTGLGLTIAADIVKNHGGTLEIDSVVGAGTTMRVLLPRASSGAA